MTIARRVRVTGRVQGVWFRAWTKEQAASLGVTGWVRNCDDGAVEAHAEGEDDAVRELIDRMRRGPAAARIDELQADDATPERHPAFAVRE